MSRGHEVSATTAILQVIVAVPMPVVIVLPAEVEIAVVRLVKVAIAAMLYRTDRRVT